MREKIIISGPGKCGTTYIMYLLSELGLDTGWTSEQAAEDKAKYPDFFMEWRIDPESSSNKPYILKMPMFSRWLKDAAEFWKWDVKHVFSCVRNSKDVASSIFIYEQDHSPAEGAERVPFLKAKDEITEEETKLYLSIDAASCTGDLMYQAALMDVPVTTLLFPRMVTDPWYLYTKLVPVLHEVGPYDRFLMGFNKVADIKKVHHGRVQQG